MKRDDQASASRVWENAECIPGLDPEVWRMAECGQPVAWHGYGNSASPAGWTVRRGKIIAYAPFYRRQVRDDDEALN